jgi:hypothetical protein
MLYLASCNDFVQLVIAVLEYIAHLCNINRFAFLSALRPLRWSPQVGSVGLEAVQVKAATVSKRE